MTCKELIEFLADYLADEIDLARRRAFEEHLSVCPPCVAYLETYKRTIELSTTAFADDPAAHEIPEELVQAILSTTPRRRDT